MNALPGRSALAYGQANLASSRRTQLAQGVYTLRSSCWTRLRSSQICWRSLSSCVASAASFMMLTLRRGSTPALSGNSVDDLRRPQSAGRVLLCVNITACETLGTYLKAQPAPLQKAPIPVLSPTRVRALARHHVQCLWSSLSFSSAAGGPEQPYGSST